jgi:hypothetical protein
MGHTKRRTLFSTNEENIVASDRFEGGENPRSVIRTNFGGELWKERFQ